MMVRAATRILAVIVLLLICFPMWAISRLFGGGAWWVSAFLRGVGWLLGLRVTIEGQPVQGDALYAANHISWLDIPALGGATRARFIAKSEIAGWSVIGFLATIGGSVYVTRTRRSETRKQANAVSNALTQGRPVVLFAEGGTGNGLTLDPFRPSLFAAANDVGATVQPVAIDYGSRARDIAWPEEASFGSEVLRMLGRPAPVPVTLRFLPRLDGGTLDRKHLAAQSQAAVANALQIGLSPAGRTVSP